MHALLASIPSPGQGSIHLGPLQIRAYGVLIALGVFAAVRVAQVRLQARGGDPNTITDLALWAVPAGVIGARIYSCITDYQRLDGNPLNCVKIWEGGLGIWGGVLGGVLAGLWVCRRRGYDFRALLDVAAPAIPLAQAIGRFGNYFNQELFGRPTRLPWGLEIDLAHRPAGYEQFRTFHPTFLYEALWNLCVVAIVLVAERRLRIRKGYLFAVYVAAYTFGRFFTEYLRIDPSHRIAGLRLNDWTSIVVFVGAATVLLVWGRPRPRPAPVRDDEREPAPTA